MVPITVHVKKCTVHNILKPLFKTIHVEGFYLGSVAEVGVGGR